MEIVILLILTFINGFFALTEIALVSVKKSKIESLAQEGNKRAKIICDLLNNPEDFLSSIQVGITLIGIIAGAYGGSAVSGNIESFLIPFGFFRPYEAEIAFAIAIGGITYISIVIGELVPKTIAMNSPEKIALFCVPILRYFMKITHPFVKALGISTSIILRVLRVKKNEEEIVGEDELLALLKTAKSQGVIENDEAEAHQNLFSFADLIAKSLVTHRSEIKWIDIHDSLEEAFAKMAASSHSKFIVGDGSLDQIVGVIKLRDFLESYQEDGFQLQDILITPLFVSESTPAFKILQSFKKTKQHIAIVIDEFGGTSGMVTLHDLIEAIVGDLPEDDDDSFDPPIVKKEGDIYSISGRIPTHEINQYFQKDIIEDGGREYATIAGFIMGNLKRMPKTGEQFTLGNLHFEIVDMDGARIDRIHLQILSQDNSINISQHE